MKIYLIYASTSGNVEITMESIAKILRYMGLQTILTRAEQTAVDTIVKNEKFVFGTSTWDHGQINPFFNSLFEHMQQLSFKNKQAAFVGLGDRRYEPVFFCRGIDRIRDAWIAGEGEEITKTLKIAGEPYSQLATVVAPWANSLAKIWGYQK